MKDVFGVGGAQLGADSTVKLLQCVVQAADRLLIGVVLAVRVSSLLSLNADRVGVVRHAPGGDLDAPAANQVQLHGQRAQLLLRFIELGAAPVFIGGARESLCVVRRLRTAVTKSVLRSSSATSHRAWISAAMRELLVRQATNPARDAPTTAPRKPVKGASKLTAPR